MYLIAVTFFAVIVMEFWPRVLIIFPGYMWMSCLTTWLRITRMPLVWTVLRRILIISSIQVYRTNPMISTQRALFTITKIQLTWVTTKYKVLYFVGRDKCKRLWHLQKHRQENCINILIQARQYERSSHVSFRFPT